MYAHAPKSPQTPSPAATDPYERHKSAIRERQRKIVAGGQEIGELPEPANLERRAKTAESFRLFCESYFPATYKLAWSDDHLKVIAKIEHAVRTGGLFAVAMPRGSGKTSLCESAAIWALFFGYRVFVCLIGSDQQAAIDMLASIKTEIETNDLLAEDFPEVCIPVQRLNRTAHRARGQKHRGRSTAIEWKQDQVVLPTIEASHASGGIIRVAGITGRIRGMKFKRADGEAVRPDLVIPDDPQTDESARSPSQCRTREGILAGAVLGLAGPGKKISGIMPCTVIAPGDMADSILDRNAHPEWQGERTKMLYSFPSDQSLWDRYDQLRRDGLRAGRGLADATAFYRAHQMAMDHGAAVAWQARFNPDEASAIQSAMNLKLQDERAFFAEYQNEPLAEDLGDEKSLTPDQIAARVNAHDRGVAPLETSHLTAFIDVQQKMLFYTVVGWGQGFTGAVLDYGAYPDQHAQFFTLANARRTMAQLTKGAQFEGVLYAGLQKLTETLLSREWTRDDGSTLRIDRCLIDANWGASTDVVYQFCRQSTYAAQLMPSHGRFVGATSQPFAEYKRKRGDVIGLNWRVPSIQGKRTVRHVLFDANFWKTFVSARLSAAMGERGALTLFGRDPAAHQLFASHLTAEYRIKAEARGRSVDEWKIRPERPDNHWLDCIVGCAVAGSMLGLNLANQAPLAPPPRPRKRERVRYL